MSSFLCSITVIADGGTFVRRSNFQLEVEPFTGLFNLSFFFLTHIIQRRVSYYISGEMCLKGSCMVCFCIFWRRDFDARFWVIRIRLLSLILQGCLRNSLRKLECELQFEPFDSFPSKQETKQPVISKFNFVILSIKAHNYSTYFFRGLDWDDP